ncbi:response regulator [Mucilaginibacter conchicola]|uniref:Response regulator n=2 Tax=Mucilaginibacter conchicola TaxID=2303333 RepID=A0A372NQM1_9SPHI|nr:response regulator [Mucilaginibacter conchicola]
MAVTFGWTASTGKDRHLISHYRLSKRQMSKKILICDDDEGILEMLEMALYAEEHEISTEINSLKLIGRIRDERPDLLILDLWMPVLSGDQITRTLKEMPEYKNLPILVISASRDGEDIARKAGANDYLAKPFDIDELLKKVESLN